MKRRFSIVIILFCILITCMSLLSGDANPAYSASKTAGSENGAPGTFSSSKCPSNPNLTAEKIGRVVCAACGDSGKRCRTMFLQDFRYAAWGSDAFLVDVNNYWIDVTKDEFGSDWAGPGLNMREEYSEDGTRKYEVYYACYNCTVGMGNPSYKYTKEYYRVIYRTDGNGGWQYDETTNETPGAKGRGWVHVTWCSDCALRTPSAGYRSGDKCPWHFPKKYELTIQVEPEGAGTVSGAGSYYKDTKVPILAVANAGYVFNGWKIDSKVTSTNPNTIRMPEANKTIIASFSKVAPEKFNLNVTATTGGTVGGDSGKIESGTENVMVYAKADDGYIFEGWEGYDGITVSTNDDRTYSEATFTMPHSDVNLKAKFVDKATALCDVKVKIHYMTGGVEDGIEELTYQYAENSVYPGHDFGAARSYNNTPYAFDRSSATGTTMDATEGYKSNSITVVGDIVIELWYEFDISSIPVPPDPTPTPGPNEIYYYPNGGGGSTHVEYTSDYTDYTHIVISNLFSLKPGYRSFGYWNTNRNGNGTSYAPGDYISYTGSSMSLYAIWTNPITYVVQFAEDAIDVQPPVLSNQEVWTYDSPSPMPAAPYEKKYTVSYDLNSNGLLTTPTMVPSSDALTAENTDAVFVFNGWMAYKYINGQYVVQSGPYAVGREYNLTTVHNDRIILFPSWGGNTSYVTLPVVSCDGYDFYGWALDPDETDLSKIFVADASTTKSYQPTDNQTLYAIYQPKTYDIYLERDIPNYYYPEFVKMTFGEKGPDVAVPVYTHYTFLGYFTQEDEGGIQYFDEKGHGCKVWDIYDGSIDTLYAHWILDSQIIYHPNSGSGTMPDTWIPDCATSATLSKNLFWRPGYHFVGWNTSADGTGTSYTDEDTIANIPLSSVVELYAQWEPNEYTVFFDANGGEVAITDRIVLYDRTYDTPPESVLLDDPTIDYSLPTPTYDGYAFVDWFTSDTNILVRDDTVAWLMRNHTLTAKWSAKTYQITFDWNFDYERPGVNINQKNEPDVVNKVFATAYGSLPEPEKDGYTFQGWYLSESDGNGTGTRVTAATIISVPKNHTLYAKWLADEYVVEFDYNIKTPAN